MQNLVLVRNERLVQKSVEEVSTKAIIIFGEKYPDIAFKDVKKLSDLLNIFVECLIE